MKDGNVSLQETLQVCLTLTAEVFLNKIKFFKNISKIFQKSTMNKIRQIIDFPSFVARGQRFNYKGDTTSKIHPIN